MPRRRTDFSKKDEFFDLDSEFKDAVAGSDEVEIRKRIAQVALDTETLLKARDDDEDLQEKKEAVKEASAIYREGLKTNRLRIKFCKRVLEDKGKAT